MPNYEIMTDKEYEKLLDELMSKNKYEKKEPQTKILVLDREPQKVIEKTITTTKIRVEKIRIVERHVLQTDTILEEPKEDYNHTDKKFSQMCYSVIENTDCKNIETCTYAHSKDVLKPLLCKFSTNCKLVEKLDNNVYTNKKGKKCVFIHQGENLTSYWNRMLLKVEKDTNKNKTQMCKSWFNNTTCRFKNCTFAHTKSELKPRMCNFGMKCKKIIDTGYHIKNNRNEICLFIHPNETKKSYLDRIQI